MMYACAGRGGNGREACDNYDDRNNKKNEKGSSTIHHHVWCLIECFECFKRSLSCPPQRATHDGFRNVEVDRMSLGSSNWRFNTSCEWSNDFTFTKNSIQLRT
jgi:hypothetical protein